MLIHADIRLDGNMTSATIITIMIALLFTAKSKKILLIIAGYCSLSWGLYYAPLDIALYYAMGVLLSVSVSLMAANLNTNSGRFLCRIDTGDITDERRQELDSRD